MTEVSRAGKQLQKKAPEQNHHYQKPFDRPRFNPNKRFNNYNNRKPFLGYRHSIGNIAQEKLPNEQLTQASLLKDFLASGSNGNSQTLAFVAGQVKNYFLTGNLLHKTL
jgi:hypothetical protein